MSRPTVITVDDDREVLRAIERDLRRKYGERYRVLKADSGQTALETLRELKVRNDALALMLVDQRMPGMSGVEFLKQAVDLFPEAKRVLLTAYADTEAAIKAINEANVNHYLLKPWDPPEQNLYPVLDDLLGDWLSEFRPGFQGIRLLGTRWSPQSHQMRDFLARNHIPYQWLDMERWDADADVRRIGEAAGVNKDAELPVVIFEDGSVLFRPDTSDLAAKLGLGTRAR